MKNLLQIFAVLCCVFTAVAQKEINTEFATKMTAAFNPKNLI